EFTVTNTLPGHVTLALDELHFDGITAKLDATDLAAGEKAHVTVDWKPGLYLPRALEARQLEQPTNQHLRLRVKFNEVRPIGRKSPGITNEPARLRDEGPEIYKGHPAPGLVNYRSRGPSLPVTALSNDERGASNRSRAGEGLRASKCRMQ